MATYGERLGKGMLVPLRLFGRELVLYRTEAGHAALLEAWCPHLGAHLGHGGRVEGEMLRCPFHGWAFGPDGECRDVPYAARIPRRASVASWPLVERGGRIWAWHGPRGELASYEAPVIAEAEDDVWRPYRRLEWTVRSCVQELSENGSDSAHFKFVHGMPEVPRLEPSFLGHRIEVRTPTFFPAPSGPVPGLIEVESIGLGCDVIRYSGAFELLEVVCSTPIDAQTVAVFMSYQLRSHPGSEAERLCASVADDLVAQFEKDIPIWEHKIYRPRPILCEGDGPIAEFRRWSRQFYD